MPRLNGPEVQRLMQLRGYLFKHQFANMAGLSYERLADLLGEPPAQVERELVDRLCSVLSCEPSEIVIDEGRSGE